MDFIAEIENSLYLLHKIGFDFLASKPLARRLEAIAVNLHVVSFLLGVKRSIDAAAKRRVRA